MTKSCTKDKAAKHVFYDVSLSSKRDDTEDIFEEIIKWPIY